MNAKTSRNTRALMLWLRLNQQAMQYTPKSHHGLRAARLMPRVLAIAKG